MASLILPGVYIEVRPEALIVPASITVGNIGIVGTAAMGLVNSVQTIGSFAEAKDMFGPYDAYDNPDVAGSPLTLVRGLEQAYNAGASTVFAVRVATSAAEFAALDLGTSAKVSAKSQGFWGNNMTVKVENVTPATVPPTSKVTLDWATAEEVYIVKDGNDLVAQLANVSALATAKPGSAPTTPLTAMIATNLTKGDSGVKAGVTEFTAGLDLLTEQNAHIIVTPGQDSDPMIAALTAHVKNASTDKIRHERIGIAGSAANKTSGDQIKAIEASLNKLDDPRMIYTAPGIRVTDAAKAVAATKAGGPADPTVVLPGSYTAAAIAGLLSSFDPQVSPTNKTLPLGDLETIFNSAELQQLVLDRVMVIEQRNGFRIVKGITTNDGAFRQVTTVRIVDYAKFGIRSAAEPFIGLLNNDRVRKALKGAINGFLAGMVDDEMLESYDLDVSATRDQEIRGIAQVALTLRPTFSIDFIKVVMFLG
jgi:Phage tail sheath C-terminal domain